MTNARQIRGVSFEAVRQKKELGQALNIKEFAVLAGISYSMAREWFHVPGFPAFRGMVFWEDFIIWRRKQTGLETASNVSATKPAAPKNLAAVSPTLPTRAAKILAEAQ